MRPRPPFPRLLALVPLLAAAAPAAPAAAQSVRLPPFVVLEVPKAPTVATSAGRGFLVHELHVTNLGTTPIVLRRVDVVSADGARAAAGQVIASLADSGLARAIARPGVSPPPAGSDRARIGGGLRAVVFLWIPVDAATPPRALRHRVTLAQGDTVPPDVIEGAPVGVRSDVALIGPPLRGGTWYTGNGPDSVSGHRRALVPVDGNASIAQRFGIDYLILDDSGRTHTGDRLRNASYYAQGKEAIAVADGIVAATKDSIPENVPGGRAVPITLETVGGNYVILDIGGGRYAFYAHLQPGSLRVRTGDRVRRGQVVGLVGNSGNSTEPHLHFHLMDGTSPLGSQGLPYAIERFELVGRCRTILAQCTRSAPEARTREMPLGNMMVRFPD